MNSAAHVDNDINNWKTMGMTKAELVVLIAEDCLGWPYVYGERGAYDTPAKRRSRVHALDAGMPGEAAAIRKGCQVLNGSRGDCSGCKYYPGGAKTRCFDCRGFTYWVLLQVGITINGVGATSQWNTDANWKAKGLISDMPNGQVCCVFMHNNRTGKMDHTGLYVGGGRIIHCSGEVKAGKISDKGWTHFAVPTGIEGEFNAGHIGVGAEVYRSVQTWGQRLDVQVELSAIGPTGLLVKLLVKRLYVGRRLWMPALSSADNLNATSAGSQKAQQGLRHLLGSVAHGNSLVVGGQIVDLDNGQRIVVEHSALATAFFIFSGKTDARQLHAALEVGFHASVVLTVDAHQVIYSTQPAYLVAMDGGGNLVCEFADFYALDGLGLAAFLKQCDFHTLFFNGFVSLAVAKLVKNRLFSKLFSRKISSFCLHCLHILS